MYYEAIDLRIDCHQGMKPYEAVRRVRDLEVFRLPFIEQPVLLAAMAAMAAIARVPGTPPLPDGGADGA